MINITNNMELYILEDIQCFKLKHKINEEILNVIHLYKGEKLKNFMHGYYCEDCKHYIVSRKTYNQKRIGGTPVCKVYKTLEETPIENYNYVRPNSSVYIYYIEDNEIEIINFVNTEYEVQPKFTGNVLQSRNHIDYVKVITKSPDVQINEASTESELYKKLVGQRMGYRFNLDGKPAIIKLIKKYK